MIQRNSGHIDMGVTFLHVVIGRYPSRSRTGLSEPEKSRREERGKGPKAQPKAKRAFAWSLERGVSLRLPLPLSIKFNPLKTAFEE
jgi:hypothetical protein